MRCTLAAPQRALPYLDGPLHVLLLVHHPVHAQDAPPVQVPEQRPGDRVQQAHRVVPNIASTPSYSSVTATRCPHVFAASSFHTQKSSVNSGTCSESSEIRMNGSSPVTYHRYTFRIRSSEKNRAIRGFSLSSSSESLASNYTPHSLPSTSRPPHRPVFPLVLHYQLVHRLVDLLMRRLYLDIHRNLRELPKHLFQKREPRTSRGLHLRLRLEIQLHFLLEPRQLAVVQIVRVLIHSRHPKKQRIVVHDHLPILREAYVHLQVLCSVCDGFSKGFEGVFDAFPGASSVGDVHDSFAAECVEEEGVAESGFLLAEWEGEEGEAEEGVGGAEFEEHELKCLQKEEVLEIGWIGQQIICQIQMQPDYNSLLQLKRERFRVSIRNTEVNNIFKMKRQVVSAQSSGSSQPPQLEELRQYLGQVKELMEKNGFSQTLKTILSNVCCIVQENVHWYIGALLEFEIINICCASLDHFQHNDISSSFLLSQVFSAYGLDKHTDHQIEAQVARNLSTLQSYLRHYDTFAADDKPYALHVLSTLINMDFQEFFAIITDGGTYDKLFDAIKKESYEEVLIAYFDLLRASVKYIMEERKEVIDRLIKVLNQLWIYDSLAIKQSIIQILSEIVVNEKANNSMMEKVNLGKIKEQLDSQLKRSGLEFFVKYLARFESPFEEGFAIQVYECYLRNSVGPRTELYWSLGCFVYQSKERVKQLFSNSFIVEKVMAVAQFESELSQVELSCFFFNLVAASKKDYFLILVRKGLLDILHEFMKAQVYELQLYCWKTLCFMNKKIKAFPKRANNECLIKWDAYKEMVEEKQFLELKTVSDDIEQLKDEFEQGLADS